MKMEAEIGIILPETEESVEEARKETPLQPLEGQWLC